MDQKPRYVPPWAWALFLRIAEPRVVRLIQFGTYLVYLAGGISAFVSPPNSVEGVIGSTLTVVWAGFLTLGGMLGASSVLQGVWWLERSAIVALGTGLVIFGFVVASLQLTTSGTVTIYFCIITVALLSLLNRWVRIRRYSYDPEK